VDTKFVEQIFMKRKHTVEMNQIQLNQEWLILQETPIIEEGMIVKVVLIIQGLIVQEVLIVLEGLVTRGKLIIQTWLIIQGLIVQEGLIIHEVSTRQKIQITVRSVTYKYVWQSSGWRSCIVLERCRV
jgi:hypothetical protein